MHDRSLRGMVILVALLGGMRGAAAADADADAVLVFPNVVADGVRDTLIEVSSAGSVTAFAHCWYIESLTPETDDPDAQMPAWTFIAFELALTEIEPVRWVASRGRSASTDTACKAERLGCADTDDADTGSVPPLPPGFRGELHCVEVDETGQPLGGNHLAGEATLADLVSGDVTTYRALRFGGSADDADPVRAGAADYRGCATTSDAGDDQAGGGEPSPTGTPAMRGSREPTIVPLPIQRERRPTW